MLSSTTPYGSLSSADVAGPPSPDVPEMPLPATVLMVPLVFTARITRFPSSAMKRLPDASTNIPVGLCSWAAVAGPLSPV